jgi:hypothetical protein
MNEWIRPRGSSEPWYLELVASPSGSRKGYCAFGFFGAGEPIEERTFENPPDTEDRCLACDDAYIRIPRIPPRHRLVTAAPEVRSSWTHRALASQNSAVNRSRN